jgi:uncharacterized protein YkwD
MPARIARAAALAAALTGALAAQFLLHSCLVFEELEAQQSGAEPGSRQDSAEPDAGSWDLGPLDTARTVDYLTPAEKSVILELNKVRTNPRKYAELYLAPTLKYYQGREYRKPGQITILTQEGRAAAEECIRVLSAGRPLQPLEPSKALSLAARDHVRDTGPKGIVGHTGSDGSSLLVRTRRYDKTPRAIAETISYGYADAREIVMSLLLDDGVPGRGHRKIILTPGYGSVGLSIGGHAGYRHVCVLDYSE